MEFRDLKTQYSELKEEIDANINEVLQSGQFIMGPAVKNLENELAAYVGVKHCITCANGTDALQLSLMALNVKEGDAVFVPNFTFFASAEVISLLGATPIFVDVNEETFNINPHDLALRIEQVLEQGELRLKAVIAVDLFGLPADYEEIKKVAHKSGMVVIEDGAQGFGGSINGKKACSFGDLSTTSFFPAKPLGCYGDGGAVFTDDDHTARLLESYRVHGKGDHKYDNVRIGLNSRLDAIQAGVLQVKLKAFREYELDQVNKAAGYYTQRLQGMVQIPQVKEGFYSSWAQYTIVLESKAQRDDLQAYLKEQGIPSMIYYPKPMHHQQAFGWSRDWDKEFPVTVKLCNQVLSLPMHPYLKESEQDEVCEKIGDFLGKSKG